MKKKMPVFSSRKEEAEFWDTHDVTSFAQSDVPVKDVRFELKSQAVTVRFRPDDLSRLRQVAKGKGIGVTTYIRMKAMESLVQNV